MLNENVNGKVPRLGFLGVCLLALAALPSWSLRPSSGSETAGSETSTIANQNTDVVQEETLTSRYQVDKLEWVAEGRRLVFGGHGGRGAAAEGRGAEMRVFDEKRTVRLPAIGTRWFAMSQDGKTMATVKRVNRETLEFKLWGGSKPRELKKTISIEPDGTLFQAYSFTYSPDGRMLAVGGFSAAKPAEPGSVGKLRSELILVDMETGNVHADIAPAGGQIFTLAFSGDGKTLATGHLALKKEDSSISVWDVESGELIREWPSGRHIVWRIAISPDGSRIASVGHSGGQLDEFAKSKRFVLIHNAQTGKLEHTLKGGNGAVHSVAFSPDGRLVAGGSGSGENTVRVWDVKSGKLLKTLTGHEASITAVTFSPDGKKLASGDKKKSVRIWNIEELTQSQ